MKNQIECVITGRPANIGFPVTRILPYAIKRMVGPFIFLDQMGPALLKTPRDHVDVRPHPHIGLSTLTYLFEGQLMHRDSLGVEQLIVAGEVNWMTAGKGIAHSEREPIDIRSHDRTIHGLQFWVALPLEKEDMEPSFHHYPPEVIPQVVIEGLKVRVVAGQAYGKKSGLKAHSPMTFLVAEASKSGVFLFRDTPSGHEHGLYVVKGEIKVNDTVVGEHEMVVFTPGSAIEAQFSADSVFAFIGGEPFPEPRYIFWNFVSSSKEKIEAAKTAWAEGSFPQVPGDDEKIPLPS